MGSRPKNVAPSLLFAAIRLFEAQACHPAFGTDLNPQLYCLNLPPSFKRLAESLAVSHLGQRLTPLFALAAVLGRITKR